MYPLNFASIPVVALTASNYRARFALTKDDLTRIQRLRFEVFNVELNEGLSESYNTGLDADEFDARCHHLMVEDKRTGEVVGTYRLTTYELMQGRSFYSATEFDLSSMPMHVLRDGVEAGRACVAAAHRSGRVVNLLWKGLALYMSHNRKRYFFGCCSLPGRNPGLGMHAYLQLREENMITTDFLVDAVPHCSCDGGDVRGLSHNTLPALLRMYLQLGAKVASKPAIDREFGVIDFLVLLDLEDLSDASRKRYFGTTESEVGTSEVRVGGAPALTSVTRNVVDSPSTLSASMVAPMRATK